MMSPVSAWMGDRDELFSFSTQFYSALALLFYSTAASWDKIFKWVCEISWKGRRLTASVPLNGATLSQGRPSQKGPFINEVHTEGDIGELAQKAADQGEKGPQSGNSDNLSGHNSRTDCKPIAEIAVGIAEPCRSENVKWEGGPISGDRVKIACLGTIHKGHS